MHAGLDVIQDRSAFLAEAKQLVREAQAHDGLAPVDLEQFWHDQDLACANPFGAEIPQCPMGMRLLLECAVFDELGVAEDALRYEQDEAYRLNLNRAWNDKAWRIIGRRLLPETPHQPDRAYSPVRQLSDLFESARVWQGGSWWLEQAARDENELERLLDRVERRLENLRGFLLPDGWNAQRERLMQQGVRPPLLRMLRGPVTFATSVFGAENLIFLIQDHPRLAERFRDVLQRSILRIAATLDAEAGYTPAEAPHGFHFNDDNCMLLTPAMYEQFAFPILEAVFARYSPDPGDRRFQHSDSPMGHLLPILARLNLTGVNFGPTLTVSEIRRQMPNTVIYGQLNPMTLSRNEEVNIVAEFLRDFAQARASRGLVFDTSGVINNGTRLTGIRLVMAAIQRHGRYARP